MLIRKNLPSTMTSLIQHQGFSKNDIGMISSCFAASYGWSKFAGAIISDRASSRKVFSWGLVLAGMCSLLFPLASSVKLACIVWFFEGITQGLGWPPCVILLKSWYPSSQIGRWWSLLATAGNIVSACIPLLVIFITSISHWTASYYLFGICGLSVGITVLFTIKDSPEDIGLVSFHEKKDKSGSQTDAHSAGESWYSVFFLADLWVVSAVYAILYVMNSTAWNWSQLYFVQEAGLSHAVAAACYSVYQIGAMAGNLTSGYLSDMFVTPVSLGASSSIMQCIRTA